MAISIPLTMNKMKPKPPLRHGNQQGSVSARTRRLLRLYEEDLAARYAPRTAPHYLAQVRPFLAWLLELGVELSEAKPRDLLAYQSALYAFRRPDGRPYSAAYQANRLVVLKHLFRFLYRRGYLLYDPAADLELPRLDKRLPRVILTPREAKKVIEAPDTNTPQGLRDRAILETLYATGIRVSELSNLTPYHVDTDERVLKVVLGKGRKDRNVPLTRAAAQAIEAYLVKGRPKLLGPRRARFLFLQDRGGKLDRATAARIVSAWARKAGLKKHVTPHVFRHTLATHLLRGRADIRHIQALFGHASLATTQRYTRVEVSDLREVVERAHPRGR
jgi:integrase/recombinase XerD